MNRLSGFYRTLIGLGIVALIGCMLTAPGSAGVEDSVFSVSHDGNNVAFDVRDVSRREVLQRLLQSRAIEVEWVDAAYADERISGAFNGSPDAVLQRLLAQTDFVAAYNRDGGLSRITRLIIVGKATSSSKFVGLQGTIAAAATPKPRSITIAPPTPADLMTPLYIPVSPGTVTPPLVAPLAVDKSLPLLVPQSPAESGVRLLTPREIR